MAKTNTTVKEFKPIELKDYSSQESALTKDLINEDSLLLDESGEIEDSLELDSKLIDLKVEDLTSGYIKFQGDANILHTQNADYTTSGGWRLSSNGEIRSDKMIIVGTGGHRIEIDGINRRIRVINSNGRSTQILQGSVNFYDTAGTAVGIMESDALNSFTLANDATYEGYIRFSQDGTISLNNSASASNITVFTGGDFLVYDHTAPGSNVTYDLGGGATGNAWRNGYIQNLRLTDGMTAPTEESGRAIIYVDSADGDLKVKFGDGITKTIATDT